MPQGTALEQFNKNNLPETIRNCKRLQNLFKIFKEFCK